MDFSEDNAKLPIAFSYKPAVEASCALEDPILQYICSKDFVPMMRTVFKAKLFHPISEVYRYTRTYEQGLSVAGCLMETLNECIHQVTTDEWNKWMMCFLRLQLNMLDYLNRWEDYIACFDQVRQAMADGQLDAHYSFLFSLSRYEIIQRKLNKKKRGHKLGGLLRHQQNRLSKEEIDDRFDRALQLLKHAYLSQSGCLWF